MASKKEENWLSGQTKQNLHTGQNFKYYILREPGIAVYLINQPYRLRRVMPWVPLIRRDRIIDQRWWKDETNKIETDLWKENLIEHMYDLRLMKPKDSNLTEPDRMFKEDWDKNSGMKSL